MDPHSWNPADFDWNPELLVRASGHSRDARAAPVATWRAKTRGCARVTALTQLLPAQFTQPRLSDDAAYAVAHAFEAPTHAAPRSAQAPRRDVLQCQAHGCAASLSNLRAYNQRVRCGGLQARHPRAASF